MSVVLRARLMTLQEKNVEQEHVLLGKAIHFPSSSFESQKYTCNVKETLAECSSSINLKAGYLYELVQTNRPVIYKPN